MSHRWSRREVLAGIGATVGATVLVRPAAAQGTLAKVKSQGVLKIGIADNLPWSKLNPDGSLTGIAPLTVKAVVAKMGIPKIDATVVGYGQLIPGLLAGRWDMVGASLTITTERCSQVIYSDPFYRALELEWAGWLPGTVPNPPKSFVEMGQRFERIGITNGSMVPYMQRAIETAGKKAELVQFTDPQLLIEGLLTKRVPIVTADRQTMQTLQKARGGFEIGPVDSGAPNRGSGGAFRKEDVDFRDAFVAEQRALRKSGEIAKILKEFDYVYDEKFMNISGDDACKL
jgi:polar amino acid transport system substrate-binding protein